jgi:hypothetical protein
VKSKLTNCFFLGYSNSATWQHDEGTTDFEETVGTVLSRLLGLACTLNPDPPFCRFKAKAAVVAHVSWLHKTAYIPHNSPAPTLCSFVSLPSPFAPGHSDPSPLSPPLRTTQTATTTSRRHHGDLRRASPAPPRRRCNEIPATCATCVSCVARAATTTSQQHHGDLCVVRRLRRHDDIATTSRRPARPACGASPAPP